MDPKPKKPEKYFKGSNNQAIYQAIMLGVLVIALGLMATVGVSIWNTQTINTSAWNATRDGLTGMQNMSAQFPVLGTVLALALILTALIGGLYFLFKGRQE